MHNIYTVTLYLNLLMMHFTFLKLMPFNKESTWQSVAVIRATSNGIVNIISVNVSQRIALHIK